MCVFPSVIYVAMWFILFQIETLPQSHKDFTKFPLSYFGS